MTIIEDHTLSDNMAMRFSDYSSYTYQAGILKPSPPTPQAGRGYKTIQPVQFNVLFCVMVMGTRLNRFFSQMKVPGYCVCSKSPKEQKSFCDLFHNFGLSMRETHIHTARQLTLLYWSESS